MTGKMILGIVLLIPGIVVAAWSAWALYQDTRFSKWPTVQAEVVSSEAVPSPSGNGYRFRISYRYEVDGNRYTSDVYAFRDRSMPKEEAERLAGRNRPGKPLVPYYDPADPSRAYLLRDFPVWAIPVLIVAALLAINGILLVAGKGWFGG